MYLFTKMKRVGAGRTPTKVRNLMIKDQTGSVKVALWQEKATSAVKMGDNVSLTHMTIKRDSYFNDILVQSTGDTTIQLKCRVLHLQMIINISIHTEMEVMHSEMEVIHTEMEVFPILILLFVQIHLGQIPVLCIGSLDI